MNIESVALRRRSRFGGPGGAFSAVENPSLRLVAWPL